MFYACISIGGNIRKLSVLIVPPNGMVCRIGTDMILLCDLCVGTPPFGNKCAVEVQSGAVSQEKKCPTRILVASKRIFEARQHFDSSDKLRNLANDKVDDFNNFRRSRKVAKWL